MKLVDVVRKTTKTKLRKTYGNEFYTAFDKAFGIPALEVQTSETENNMVSRATYPEKHDIYAQASGVFNLVSPEKTRGVEDILSLQSIDHGPSTPHLPGQGGFKTFLKTIPTLPTTLTDTDNKAFHSHAARAMRRLKGAVLFDSCHDSREQPGRLDFNLLCPSSGVESPT